MIPWQAHQGGRKTGTGLPGAGVTGLQVRGGEIRERSRVVHAPWGEAELKSQRSGENQANMAGLCCRLGPSDVQAFLGL